MCLYRGRQCLLFFFVLIKLVLAHWENETFSTVEEAVPWLQGLQKPSEALGGWSYFSCCRLAVNDSLSLKNGTLEIIPGRFLKVHDVSEFAQSQPPCNAKYNGSRKAAPDVMVPYRYCKDICRGGWMRSESFTISQWALPFVGFILPAVFFCFAVPRTRRIRIPDALFPKTDFPRNLELLYKVPLALTLAIVDTVVLVSLVLTQAGPMILSGLHEALMASRVLDYLEEQDRLEGQEYDRNEARMGTRDRIHLLLALLVSNLQHERAWDKTDRLVEEFSSRGNEENTKAQLRAMLDSQMNFGLTVGAPAIIYVAAFIYTIIEIRSSLGDNDTSQALAFGELWMTVPHATIVSSCLLGGNNPNTLQLLAPDPHAPKGSRGSVWNRWMKHVFSPIFKSTYQPHWMWNRGRSANEWFGRILCNSPEAYPNLGATLEMSMGDWAFLNLGAFALVFMPCFLGGLTAYTTPPLCLSCRSLAIAVYLCSQIILIALKDWEYACWGMPQFSKGAKWIDENRKERVRHRHHPWLDILMLAIWHTTYAIATLAALLSSVGATTLQLIGVLRTCLCSVSIQYWSNLSSPAAIVPVGSNSAAQQKYAQRVWEPTGITATLFLVLICFGCWWYQSRLRIRYEHLVENSFGETQFQKDFIIGGDKTG